MIFLGEDAKSFICTFKGKKYRVSFSKVPTGEFSQPSMNQEWRACFKLTVTMSLFYKESNDSLDYLLNETLTSKDMIKGLAWMNTLESKEFKDDPYKFCVKYGILEDFLEVYPGGSVQYEDSAD